MAGQDSLDVYNWLLVLGLDFDPAPSDPGIIRKAYDDKLKLVKLSSNMNNSDLGGYYRSVGDALGKSQGGQPAVLRMLNDATTRERLAQEASSLVYGQLDKLIRTAANASDNKREVAAAKLPQIAKFAQKSLRKTPAIPKDWECGEELIRKRAKALGITLLGGSQPAAGGAKGADQAAYEPYSAKARSKWRSRGWDALDKALETFGCSTVYEYACPSGYEDRPTSAPSNLIARRAKELSDAQKQHNAAKTSAETIASNARAIFQNNKTRAEYDAYLEFKAVRDRLAEFETLVDLGDGVASDEALDQVTREVASAITNTGQAPLIVRGFCREKRIRLGNQPEAVYCRCGHANAPGSAVCQGCGLPLRVKCPACGKELPNTSDYCSCGQPVGKRLGEAADLLNDAQKAYERYDLALALERLGKAKEAWPGLARYAELERNIAVARREVGPAVTKVRQLLGQRHLVEARAQLEAAKRARPGFAMAAAEREISQGLSEAAAKVRKAKAATSENARASLHDEALQLCADQPDAIAYMRRNPPEPPEGLSVNVDATHKRVHLSWRPSPSAGSVTYEVRRGEGRPIAAGEEGTLVATGAELAAQDARLQAGHAYYYTVSAQRWGASSHPLASQRPAYLLSEVEGLVVTPGNGQVRFAWKQGDAGEMEIDELSPEQQVIARSSAGSFTHTGLTNGTTYTYRGLMVYRLAEGVQRTAGITVKATPIGTCDFVRDLHAARTRGDAHVFDLSWTEPAGATVTLFMGSDRNSLPKEGTALPLAQLQQGFRNPQLSDVHTGHARLGYASNQPAFVFPAAVFGQTAVVGSGVRVCGKQDVRIAGVRHANDQLVIDINAPANATGFAVLYRPDRFARDLHESGASGVVTRQMVSLKTYQRDGNLRIPYDGSHDYYLSVYATYAGGSHSEPAEYLFSARAQATVRYSIHRSAGLVGSRKATITFWSDQQTFTLPRTAIEYGVGVLPVLEGSGTPVKELPKQEVSGSLKVEVALPHLKNLYLRVAPVGRDARPYLLEAGSSNKVS